MKRLVTLAVMAAFILCAFGTAQAIELKAKGDWQISGNYVKNPTFDKDAKIDPFMAVQRVRTTFEFIANENLKGVIRINMNDRIWGSAHGYDDQGNYTNFDVGQRTDMQYDRAYLDFMIPNTSFNLKAGLAPITLPNSIGSHILDDNVWTVMGSTQFNDMIGLTFGWGRLADDSQTPTVKQDKYSKDEVDMFYAIVPVTMDGFQLNPFAVYARSGKYALNQTEAGKSANHYWFGINATVDAFDPIVIMADFNYGGRGKIAEVNGEDIGKAGGWIADLGIAYKMDMMTPTLLALYESGESSSSYQAGKTSRIMPSVSGDLWGISSFGFTGSNFRQNAKGRLPGAYSASGKFGVALRLKDITFMENLDHTFTLGYYKGTNDKDSGQSFTTKDSAWEVNFDSQYQMYENLAAILELGYIGIDLDKDIHGDSGDNAWKAAAGFRYKF